ncbi:MAG: hypothetical protein E7099_05750 [Mediterranea massiliensis]|nr:hypothetical protein [Mediterranea massiliensis]
MKKKFMMFALLVGALSLGSCVDDSESQSVTAVRDAKTKELKSIAAMEAAQAQATRTMAAAEAAMKAAQAEAQAAAAAKAEAEAALKTAEAELIELQKQAAELENEADRIANEAAQAELEAQMAALEVTKKENEAKLAEIAALVEKQAIENEEALAKAQKALLDAQQALATQLANADDAEKQKLQTLASNYSLAVENLILAQQNLSTLRTQLVNLETGKASAEETMKADVETLKENIAWNQLQIESYKEYTNYLEEYDSLIIEYNKMSTEYSKLYDTYQGKYKAYSKARDERDLTEAEALTDSIYADPFYHFNTNNGEIILKNKEGEEVTATADWTLQKYYKFYSLYQTSGTVAEYKYEINHSEHTSKVTVDSLYMNYDQYKWYGYEADIRTIELEVNDYLVQQNADKKIGEDALTAAQAQYNGKAKYGTGTFDAEGNEIMKEGKNAVDSTAYLKAEYEKILAKANATDQEIADAKSAYEIQLGIELALKADIATYTGNVDAYAWNILVMEKSWDLFSNFDANKAKLDEKIAAYNESMKATYTEKIVALWTEYMDAYVEYRTLQTEQQTLYNILNNDNGTPMTAKDIKDAIETLEADIETKEGQIAEKEKMIYQGDITYEAAIEYKKAEIAAQEAVVAAKKVAVEQAKAALDAAMPKDEEVAE